MTITITFPVSNVLPPTYDAIGAMGVVQDVLRGDGRLMQGEVGTDSGKIAWKIEQENPLPNPPDGRSSTP